MDTVELCFGAIECLDKTQLLSKINAIEDSDIKLALFMSAFNKLNEAEKILISNKKFLWAAKINIKNFRFQRALEIV